MGSELFALCLDAADPAGLAAFWAAMLGSEVIDDRGHTGGAVALVPTADVPFRVRFLASAEPKVAANRMHFDLTSTSLEDQEQTVARALALGARPLDVGQRPDEDHVVLADPEGNEFCVIEPDNAFLADCGLLGALSCDGSRAVGHFWSRALDWPLVWDQDQETAIRSPRGGPKITWGGSPPAPPNGRDRVHLDLVVPPDGHRAELERLVSLGATPVHGDVLVDPDQREFCVLHLAPKG
jgi:hypothetical protein